MNVDRERIAKLISSIREAVALLQELQALSSDEFIGDKHKQSSAKYNFIFETDWCIATGTSMPASCGRFCRAG